MPREHEAPRGEELSFFRISAWLPLAMLVGVKVYVERFDGVGAWAAAPLFLVPVVSSAALVLLGALELRAEASRGGARTGTLAAAALASLPLLWFLSRVLLQP